MHQRYDKFQKSSYILAIVVFILLVVCALFYMLLRKSKRREQNISDELYTHTRSGLQNLKMMNISLRTSLKQSRTAMEQWEMGELINEPLNDRLRFAMVELPFLTDMYIKEGYHIGLKVEKAFGQHVQEQLSSSARLYHFFDSMFLYIEPNTDPNSDPQELFERIQDWVDTFKTSTPIDTHIRVGLADYPFLPRAYTAINDKELIDILLLSTEMAREHQTKDPASQWVHLQAITHAPAASFVGSDIRHACQQAIDKGLVKIHSSFDNEENNFN
jgi:GGDEF domain-containing protein